MEHDPQPLDDIVIDFLMSKTSETAEYDFKYLIYLKKESDFVKIAEDIFAMANYGGGYLLFGFREKKNTKGYDPIGLPDEYHVDGADIQRKFNSYSNEPITLHYLEFDRKISLEDSEDTRTFAIMYIPPSKVVLYPRKDGRYRDRKGSIKFAFRDKDTLIRRGSVTDRATPTEIDWIKRRVKNENFKISLLSGKPDILNENIYSNFFEVIDMPQYIFEACILEGEYFYLKDMAKNNDVAIVIQGDFVYSFDDLYNEKYVDYLNTETLIRNRIEQFKEDNPKLILLKWLLNNEVSLYLLKKKFRYDSDNKNIYFYPKIINKNEPAKTNDRRIRWRSRYKTSYRYVVKYRYEPKLGKFMYRHDAAKIKFTTINNEFYLMIIPGIVLSNDGFNAVHNVKQGPVITRLLHNEYNDKYLNNVLFWISRFFNDDDDFIILNDRIKISTTPIITDIDIGIRYDRLNKEFKNRIEEMYAVGDT